MQVFKFGGASVKDAEGVRNVKEIIKLYSNEKLLIVISAMGKTTNALEKVANAFYRNNNECQALLKEARQYHFNIVNELFEKKENAVYHDIENCFVELDWIIEDEPHKNYDFVYDQIVSMGEILSTRIVAHYLKMQGIACRWIDARGYIITDNNYREGNVNTAETSGLIQKDLPVILEKEIIITQGFIGGTSENYTTTLGREGSDYSAALFASALDAEAVTIWKDVPGVLSADPKLFKDTTKFESLPYSEALEMTFYGATVIHPKTIRPLQNKSIPLIVKPFLSPSESGTVISAESSSHFESPSVIIKKNQILLSLGTKDYSFMGEENLSNILRIFSENKIRINMMQNSAMTFSCCADFEQEEINKLINVLEKDFTVHFNTELELITVRHYQDETLKSLSDGRYILLEQKSRSTAQLVIK